MPALCSRSNLLLISLFTSLLVIGLISSNHIEEKNQAFEARAVGNISASRVVMMTKRKEKTKEIRSKTKEETLFMALMQGSAGGVDFKSSEVGPMRKLGEEKMQVFIDPKLAVEALAAGQPELCVFCYCCDPPPCGHKPCCTDMVCNDPSKPKGACTFTPKRCTCEGCNT